MPKTNDINVNSIKVNGVVISFDQPDDSQTICYNKIADRWEPHHMPRIINDMQDIDLEGLLVKDVLIYDGQQWVPHGHINDAKLHYTVDQIDHNKLQNVGSYSHVNIDRHINNDHIHYAKNSIKHNEIQNIGIYTHDQIDSHLDDTELHYKQQDIDHNLIKHRGEYDHEQIDAHINGNGSDHAFIDQDVTRLAKPTFQSIIVTKDPTISTAVTTKAYVDAIAQGIIWQPHVIDFWDPTNGLPEQQHGSYISTATANRWKKNFIYDSDANGVKAEEKWAVWIENLDSLYVFNGRQWVKIGSTTEHGNLRGIGVHSHADIDEHIENNNVHFAMSDIDHSVLKNHGIYNHTTIDQHIDNKDLHFNKSDISHHDIQDTGAYDHSAIDSHIDDTDSNPHNVTLQQLLPESMATGDLITADAHIIKSGQPGQVLTAFDNNELDWCDLPPEEGSLTEVARYASTDNDRDFVIDQHSLESGDVVLIHNDNNNGLYIFENGMLNNLDKELSAGDQVFIQEGRVHKGSIFIYDGVSFVKASGGDANYPITSVKKIKRVSVDSHSTIILPFSNNLEHDNAYHTFDPEHLFSSYDHGYHVKCDGYYLISANMYIKSGIASGKHILRLFITRGKNRTEDTRASIRNQNDVNLTFGTRIMKLLSGDMLQCVYENGTPGFVVIGGGLDFFNVVKLR